MRKIGFGAILLSLMVAGGASAQSVEQIARDARDAAVRRAQNVNNYTVVEESNGTETTRYCEKKLVDGFPTFDCRAVSAGAGGMSMGSMGMANPDVARDAMDQFNPDQFFKNAKLQGTETVDGNRAFKLLIDDFTGIDALADLNQPNSPAKMKSVTLWIDAARYLPLKMAAQGDLTLNGQTRPITVNATMSDYKGEQGFLLPHRMAATIEGLGDAMTAQQRAQLDQAKAMLDQLPPEMRAQAAAALNAVSGNEMVVTVKSLKLNSGPPGTAR